MEEDPKPIHIFERLKEGNEIKSVVNKKGK